MRRLLWVLGFACAAAVLALWLLPDDPQLPRTPLGTASGQDEAPAAPAASAGLDRSVADTGAVARTSGTTVSSLEALAAATATGYRGRVVAAADEPVPGIAVQLLRASAEAALPLDLDVFARIPAAPELVVARTTTDSEGRFLLTGIAPRGLVCLRLAWAEPAAAPLRFRSGHGTFVPVQRAPAPGEVQDLGDVRLKVGATLVGRVVGADGPIAGARIRAARLPPLPFAAVPIERLQRDGVFVVTAAGDSGVVELPEWVGRILDVLPIAEAFSGADGGFVVHGVDAGDVVVAANARHQTSLLRQGVKAVAGQTLQLGDLLLADGCTAEVAVVDATGEPVAGAEVVVAPLSTGIPVHVGERAGATDADGKLAIDGLPRGRALAAARRPDEARWHVGEPGSADGVLRVVLPARHALTVTVLDAAGRVPGDIRVQLVAGASRSGVVELAMFGLRRPADAAQHLERLEDGRLRFRDLAAGNWCLVVSAAACATQSVDLELRSDLERTVQLRPARALRVRTVDVAGEPVADTKLHLSSRGGSRAERIVELPLAVGRTGPDGWCTVRDLPTDSARLTAVHALHGQVHAMIEGHPAELVLQFAAPASIRGILTDGGRPPAPGRWVLVLERRHEGPRLQRGAVPDLPQLALPDLAGAFAFPALQPGKYRVTAQDSLTDIGTVAGMVQYMARQKQILPWNKAEVDLRSGDDVEVRLDAILDAAPYDGPGAAVRGTVSIDRLPAVGAVVVGSSKQPDRRITSRVDRGGGFDLGRCPVGDLRVVVVPHEVAESRLKENLFSHHYARDLQVIAEQPVELRIEIATGGVFGEVRDWNGAAVDDCRVVLYDRGGDGRSSSLRVARTDGRGAFRFEGMPSGVYELRAEREGLGKQLQRTVAVLAGGATGPVAVVLGPVAKVEGRIEWTAPGQQGGLLWLRPRFDGEEVGGGILPDGRFEFAGVPVGHYLVQVRRRGESGRRDAGEVDVRAPRTADLVLRVP